MRAAARAVARAAARAAAAAAEGSGGSDGEGNGGTCEGGSGSGVSGCGEGGRGQRLRRKPQRRGLGRQQGQRAGGVGGAPASRPSLLEEVEATAHDICGDRAGARPRGWPSEGIFMGKAHLRIDAKALGKGQVFARRRASQRGGTAGLRLVRFAPGGALRRPPLRGGGHRGRGRATRPRTAKLP